MGREKPNKTQNETPSACEAYRDALERAVSEPCDSNTGVFGKKTSDCKKKALAIGVMGQLCAEERNRRRTPTTPPLPCQVLTMNAREHFTFRPGYVDVEAKKSDFYKFDWLSKACREARQSEQER